MSTVCQVKLESRHWAAIGLGAIGVAIVITGRAQEYLTVIVPALIGLMGLDKALAMRNNSKAPSPPSP